MNKDQADGNWKQFKGKVKEKWGKLTDDDLTVIEGKRDQLVGKSRKNTAIRKSKPRKKLRLGKITANIAGSSVKRN